MRRRLVTLIATAVLGGMAAAGAVVQVAPVLGEEIGFASPATVVPKGQGLTFVNADPASYNHNLVADEAFFARGKNTAPWCAGYPSTRCPVFWSEIISAGAVTPVEGVAALKAGEYHYVCTLHALMVGTLIVV